MGFVKCPDCKGLGMITYLAGTFIFTGRITDVRSSSITCGRCKGYGTIPGSLVTCPLCLGFKRVEALLSSGGVSRINCPECRGEGKIRGTEEIDIQKIIDENEEPLEMEEKKTFVIKIEGNFVPTTTYVKNRLGLGYNVLSVEVSKDYPAPDIKDAESAAKAIIYTGHRELVRRLHPDLQPSICPKCQGKGEVISGGLFYPCPDCKGSSPSQTMINLNLGKKQLDEVMKLLEAPKI